MTEKTAPWWRSFVGKRRKAARESAYILEQELAVSNQRHDASTLDLEQQNTSTINSQSQGGNSVNVDDTYDDTTVQPTFNESANRRNLRVSRSGRFKEKRRVRVGLPSESDNAEDSSKGNTD